MRAGVIGAPVRHVSHDIRRVLGILGIEDIALSGMQRPPGHSADVV